MILMKSGREEKLIISMYFALYSSIHCNSCRLLGPLMQPATTVLLVVVLVPLLIIAVATTACGDG
jgi:hypothetical protein